MTKVDIFSGFLGAGKTTLIKKLIAEAYQGEKLVLIENEFGEINIDGGFLKDSGIEISEMSAGCICCTLVGDFHKSLLDVYERYNPDRILIEPSGVGKLSDVILAVEDTIKESPNMELNSFTAVVDATEVDLYMHNFGEFYNNQIETAGTIVLSRTQKLTQEKLEASVALVREHNTDAVIITTPWDKMEGKVILSAIEKVSLEQEMMEKIRAEHEADEAEHHHHHEHDEECHHHHEHDEECHHHHEHDEECHHHHEHDEEHHHGDGECCCHHHHHHADEVFKSWGKETPKVYSEEKISSILEELDTGAYGNILRAKGIVSGSEGNWIEFDYVPGEKEIRKGTADYTGRFCVIGVDLKEEKLESLF